MKKALIFAMFAVLLVGFVLAIPAPATPVCKVEGTIQNIEFKAAYNDTCVLDNTCPTDTLVYHKDEYSLNILINKISNISVDETDSTTCEEEYILGESKVFTILKTNVNVELKEDQTIKFQSNPYLNLFSSYEIINETVVGASCGTVTPGTNNECCINKGYSGWNETEFKCIGENDEENETNVGTIHNEDNETEEVECDAWKCTKWGACLNGVEKRTCTKLSNCTSQEQKPRLTKNCSEKDKLQAYNKTADCPENCTCSGSTVKCTSEDGTRTMTIYAGKSGNVIVQVKNINMSTNVTLYKSVNGTLYAVFKGNKTEAIILPDDVLNRIQERTKAKLSNESINLTEDGYYLVQSKKHARLFWLIPVRENIGAQVDAETGAIIKIRNPWWGFLARDVKD